MSELENLWTLTRIAEELDVSLRQLYRWEERRDKIGFPEPQRTLGRFKFFDVEEVREWIFLWRRATAGMGNKTLNGDD